MRMNVQHPSIQRWALAVGKVSGRSDHFSTHLPERNPIMSFRVPRFAAMALRRTSVVIAMLAGCLVAASASATPISLATPAGLNPGDQFRFVFVTLGTITAESSDIEVYNSFVNTQAASATYGGSTVSWKAIGSTDSVDARDNVGGYGTSVPVYLVDGTRVADDLTENTNGMWSGNLISNINGLIDGTLVESYDVYTGTGTNGLKASGFTLGSARANYGVSSREDEDWIAEGSDFNTYDNHIYGMSETLTVGGASPVPEIDPAGMGSVLALVTGALGLLERRRLKSKAA
jgi:hypothetical protein